MRKLSFIITGLLLCIATSIQAAYPEGYVMQPHDHIILGIDHTESAVMIEDGSTWYIRDKQLMQAWEKGDVVRVMDINPDPALEKPEYTIVMMNIGREEQSEVKEVAGADPELLPKVVAFKGNVLVLDDGSKWEVPQHLAKQVDRGLLEGGSIVIRRTLTWAYSYLLFTENGTELQAKSLTK